MGSALETYVRGECRDRFSELNYRHLEQGKYRVLLNSASYYVDVVCLYVSDFENGPLLLVRDRGVRL